VFVRRGLRTDLVYRIGADGRGLRRLSPPCRGDCLGDGFPAFSRDGLRIAFERDVVHGIVGSIAVAIFAIKADGRDPSELTPVRRTSDDHEPQWLPGGRIAFTRLVTSGPDAGAGALFEMNADGGNVRQVTPFSQNYPNDARWSPDGKEILFDSANEVESARPVNVLTVHVDGSARKQLTHFTGAGAKGFVGAWSPDGRWIVWHRSGRGGLSQLFIMDASGRHLHQLTHLPAGANPQTPAWGKPVG
jgi:TolB protein